MAPLPLCESCRRIGFTFGPPSGWPVHVSYLHRRKPSCIHALPNPRTSPKPAEALATVSQEFAESLSSGDFEAKPYNTITATDIVQERSGWLVTFCVGLIAAAIVVEHFETLIEKHVQLSFFVPLIMGHGGNTGSQTVSSVIRAIALRQVRWRTSLPAVMKEALAGGMMGGVIGLLILGLSMVWSELDIETGITVAVALPLVSAWANGLACFITLASNKLKLDSALISGPLVTTLVDSTGLVIYFAVAETVLKTEAMCQIAKECLAQ